MGKASRLKRERRERNAAASDHSSPTLRDVSQEENRKILESIAVNAALKVARRR